MSTEQAAFVFGVVGGVVAEFFSVWLLRHKPLSDWPDHYGRLTYWVPTVVMILAGGFLALAYAAYGDTEMNPLLAMQVGISTPLIIQKFIQAVPAEID